MGPLLQGKAICAVLTDAALCGPLAGDAGRDTELGAEEGFFSRVSIQASVKRCAV